MKVSNAIIDVSKGTEMYHGSQSTYLEILELFVKELRQQCGELLKIKAKQDYKQARFLVHKIRGGASYCAVPTLLKDAEVVEEMLLKYHDDGLDQQIDKILGSIKQVEDAYRDLFDKVS